MTYTLYLVIIIAVLSVLFSKKIHKYNNDLYLIALVIVIFTTTHTPNIVNLGYVSIAFFIVTLFSGLLDKGKLRKRLFTVRAETAILGSILLFPHAYGYFEFYLVDIGLENSTVSFFFGLAAYILMIPLFITSFQKVRRKMKYKSWKKLHKISYIFFMAVGIHLILLQNENMFLYILIFGFYFIMKSNIVPQKVSVKQGKQFKTKVVGT